MKIAVLCGSSKQARNSNTMQYLFYLEKHFPEHDFSFLQVGLFFNTIDPDMQFLKKSMETIEQSDAVLWAFPVYFGLVPFALKQFIEKVIETKSQNVFQNKYSAAFSTSIHLFDDIAHNYLRGICEDWGMNYYGFFSVDVFDFSSPKKMENFIIFSARFFYAVSQKEPCQTLFQKISYARWTYVPGEPFDRIPLKNKSLLLVEDTLSSETNIKKMTTRFASQFTENITTVNLHSIGLRTGCSGCLKCGDKHICPLKDSPGLVALSDQIKKSDIIIFAGEVKDRFLSSLWKLFFDRSFFRGHPPNKLQGKQIGFIFSGPFSQTNILNRVFTSFAELAGSNLSGIISDESNCSRTIDRLLRVLALKSVSFSEASYSSPITSYALGTLKITRDDIYGRLSFLFRSDYKHFKKSGVFDFPQTRKLQWLRTRAMTLLLKLPFLKKLYYKHQTSIIPFLFKKKTK